ncbi:MAG TPA: DNA polymerase III subunit gamma/tau [Candidatus Babeliaceae bacterium]|nr:DNA polymerase III subunit gamma/tau [Candidatus Babeliaceae bacterium]
MSISCLNLARKLRPRTFDQVVGQELVVRLLKNSLYRQLFFPVYLFSGQRGCGKTTLARIFAGAVNCEGLSEFCKNPRMTCLPCLSCSSCYALIDGSHPDIIEVDAASHTGVDNIRQIIQSATFIPLIGKKKVYLIDEAHMLSKAAFNAFLKILEEPPASVIFLLATTDPEKIIDTVRSRCFQLFLEPLPLELLTDYLLQVCKDEGLEYDKEGIKLVAHESDGSVRDALNVLERGRLFQGKITKSTMVELLGHCDNDFYVNLMKSLSQKSLSQALEIVDQIADRCTSWAKVAGKLAVLIHQGVLSKYGSPTNQSFFLADDIARATEMFSVSSLIQMLEIYYDMQLLFSKTHNRSMFDLLLIRFFQKLPEAQQKPVASSAATCNIAPESKGSLWDHFIALLTKLEDPRVLSIFKQAKFNGYRDGNVEVTFNSEQLFFKEILEETVRVWKPCLDKAFGKEVQCVPSFEHRKSTESTVAIAREVKPVLNKVAASPKVSGLNDKEKWKKVYGVLNIFPGVAKEEGDDTHD